MNGAECLIKTAKGAGVEVCFVNAGTTEIPMVLALDSEPGVRAVLGLFEGVCTGAADGYGRVLGRPASTLLHLGPGFANGIANLHNARRAGTPLLNLVGEHATWHRAADAPLTMNIEGLAGTVSGWYRTCNSVDALSQDMAEAIAETGYGLISTLIVPNDMQWDDFHGREIASLHFSFEPVDPALLHQASRLLRTRDKKVLILGGRALRLQGLQAAARIRAATGCDLLVDSFPPYVERGAGLPDITRIPYFPEPAAEILSPYEVILLAGASEPVTFFGYPGVPSKLLRVDQQKLILTGSRQDAVEALEHLADDLNAPAISKIPVGAFPGMQRPGIPTGQLTPDKICMTLAALQPENAIIVDEGLTTSTSLYSLGAGLPPHSLLTIVGGAIGYGMPCSLGAAIACPERPVINLQADGSAMYTVQALWTLARESAEVTTLICSNRSYHILKVELARAGIIQAGQGVSSLFDLDRPDIGWVKIAAGMGVPAVSVRTAEELAKEFGKALSEPGPHLIEMEIVPK